MLYKRCFEKHSKKEVAQFSFSEIERIKSIVILKNLSKPQEYWHVPKNSFRNIDKFPFNWSSSTAQKMKFSIKDRRKLNSTEYGKSLNIKIDFAPLEQLFYDLNNTFIHSHKKRKDNLETWTVLLIFLVELELSGLTVQQKIAAFSKDFLSGDDFETF